MRRSEKTVLRSRFARLGALAVLAAAVALLWPETALGCAVCFGDPEAPMTQGLNRAIYALLGTIALVQIGVVKVIWDIRKRTRDKNDPVELRLVQGGK